MLLTRRQLRDLVRLDLAGLDLVGELVAERQATRSGPPATPIRLADKGDGVAAVADANMPALTADTVRDTLERVRAEEGD